MKKISTFCICLITVLTSTASYANAKNHFFLEMFGNGLLYTFNYEHLLSENIAARIGWGNIGSGAETNGIRTSAHLNFVPVMINGLLGDGDHKFEVGAGPLFIFADASFDRIDHFSKISGSGVLLTSTFGYRYQPNYGGITFKASFTPLITKNGVMPWFGVGIGYAF